MKFGRILRIVKMAKCTDMEKGVLYVCVDALHPSQQF